MENDTQIDTLKCDDVPRGVLEIPIGNFLTGGEEDLLPYLRRRKFHDELILHFAEDLLTTCKLLRPEP